MRIENGLKQSASVKRMHFFYAKKQRPYGLFVPF
jgi:hypothetical protein